MEKVKKNIYEKMLEAQTKIGVVGKKLDVGLNSNKYKAVSERDVLDAVKKIEQEVGIYSFCYSREVVQTNESTSIKGVISYWKTFINKYKFVNTENPDDFIETITFSDGVDSQDKGCGKGMTYADKYALMKMYKISTGDDLEKDASIEQIDVLTQTQANQLIEYGQDIVVPFIKAIGKNQMKDLTGTEAKSIIERIKEEQKIHVDK